MPSLKGDDGVPSGFNPNKPFGVWGDSGTTLPGGGNGVVGSSQGSHGVVGFTLGSDRNAAGVYGGGPIGVQGESDTSIGVFGKSDRGTGVFGSSETSVGVQGSSHRIGVRGFGFDNDSTGVAAISNGTAGAWLGGSSAGEFFGGVNIVGSLTASGVKAFKIDHPLDPSNKYLYHSSVESPEMKNVYDGVVVLDAKGEAVVVLAAWFEALNKEFRYQLTPISAPGPNLHIAEEIKNQRFKIAGGSSGMKVCWQVTGIRQDALAQANPLVVEQDKLANERDHYLHPEAHGYPAQKSIVEARYSEEIRQFREKRRI